jgi:hypothetical protein
MARLSSFRRWLGCLICCLVCGLAGPAPIFAEEPDPLPSIADLQRAYIAENGGLANLSDVRSLLASGVVTDDGGNEIEVTVYKKRPNLLRIRTSLPGGHIDTVFDGERAFRLWDRVDGTEVEFLEPGPTQNLAAVSTLEGPFYALRVRPEWLRVVGRVEVRGSPAFEIEVSEAADSIYEKIWLSEASYQEIKVRKRLALADGSELVEDIYFSEFDRVHGVWYARVAAHERGGEVVQTVRIDQARANVGIFDTFFSVPED